MGDGAAVRWWLECPDMALFVTGIPRSQVRVRRVRVRRVRVRGVSPEFPVISGFEPGSGFA